MKLKSLPKVRVCVGYVNKGKVVRIFGNKHSAPIIREGVDAPIIGEILLRDAIKTFNLNIEEVIFLR